MVAQRFTRSNRRVVPTRARLTRRPVERVRCVTDAEAGRGGDGVRAAPGDEIRREPKLPARRRQDRPGVGDEWQRARLRRRSARRQPRTHAASRACPCEQPNDGGLLARPAPDRAIPGTVCVTLTWAPRAPLTIGPWADELPCAGTAPRGGAVTAARRRNEVLWRVLGLADGGWCVLRDGERPGKVHLGFCPFRVRRPQLQVPRRSRPNPGARSPGRSATDAQEAGGAIATRLRRA
jgi:hypothetical protein